MVTDPLFMSARTRDHDQIVADAEDLLRAARAGSLGALAIVAVHDGKTAISWAGKPMRLIHGLSDLLREVPDPLGVDTTRPIEEVAQEMAEAALSGRNADAVQAELERFHRRRSPKETR